MKSYQFFGLVAASVVIRFLLFYSSFDFSDRIEFNTPTTSFKRLLEGLYFLKQKQSPYMGKTFIQPPLLLIPFQIMPSSFYPTFFIALDLLVAYIIYRVADISNVTTLQLFRNNNGPSNYKKYIPAVMAFVYLYNPVMILSCVSMSTSIFNNLVTASILLFMVKGNITLATGFVALGDRKSVV